MSFLKAYHFLQKFAILLLISSSTVSSRTLNLVSASSSTGVPKALLTSVISGFHAHYQSSSWAYFDCVPIYLKNYK